MPAPNFIALHSLFERGRPNASPVCQDGQRLVTWGEFAGQVSAQASRLKSRTEKRWLLAEDDCKTFTINLFALLYAGRQVVIPPNTQPGTLLALADGFDAQLLDAPAGDESVSPGTLMPIDPHTAIIDLYTSGSTGEPKQVRKTLAQFETEVAVLESLWGATLGAAAIVATVPHQHIYGLLFRILWPLAAGRMFDTLMCAHPDLLEERLAVLGETALVSSPAQLSRLPELVSLNSLSPKPKAIFSSGGPLPGSAAIMFLQQLGQAPTEIFGSTETGGIAWRRQESGTDADLWTPFPGIEIQRSENSALMLRSPFLNTHDLLKTDDGIELLPNGHFRLLGRLDRIVKIEEKRLSLPDMESRLNAHAWVTASALLALSGHRQSIGAVLELSNEGRQQLASNGRRALSQALRKHLTEHFEAVLLPRHWRFLDHLPTNERGKLSKAILAAQFATDKPAVLYPEILADRRNTDDDNQIVLDLRVTSTLEHFTGHFPGLPILPGVVQIDWAVRYARQYLTLNGVFSALENIKFLGLVLPDARLQLSLKWNTATQRLDFSYVSSQRKHSTGRIIFSAK